MKRRNDDLEVAGEGRNMGVLGGLHPPNTPISTSKSRQLQINLIRYGEK